MTSYFDVVAVSSPERELEEVANDEGVRTAPVLMTRTITPIKDLQALHQLYKLFKKEKPGIVHTHTPKAGLLGMIAAKLAGVPLRLHTVAGMPLMETKGIKRKLLEQMERLTYANASRVYPNSVHLSGFILDHKFCKSSKLKVLGNGSSNGIDTDYFKMNDNIAAAAAEIRKTWKIDPSCFVFVFVGRLVKDKGLTELVDAFVSLKKTQPGIKLLMVGDYEPDLDPLPQHTVNLMDADVDIISVGFQKDIRPYLAISHALAFPSYREGFPNVPMQAACFDLPCIVTDINGCNEIIEQKKNGLIIPTKNTKALLEAMQLLVADKDLYAKLKGNARPMIVQRYKQEHIWQLLLKEYEDQLAKYETVPQLSETAA